jgi:hypothetical protein
VKREAGSAAEVHVKLRAENILARALEQRQQLRRKRERRAFWLENARLS